MDITKDFLRKVFKFSKLDERYVYILTDKIEMYRAAFISPSFDPLNNYELYEKLGDATANEAIVWYFYTIFPQLRCPAGVKVIASLKNLYASTEYFSKFAETLGFWPYVKATADEIKSKEKKQKLLEDVFEAFLGATKLILLEKFGFYGTGNEIVYSIIKSLLDGYKISLEEEDLYDAKTRLKEFFDKPYIRSKFGRVEYKLQDNENEDLRVTNLYFVKDNIRTFISKGIGISKVAQEKDAAKYAIQYLKRELKKDGYEFEKRGKLFCE